MTPSDTTPKGAEPREDGVKIDPALKLVNRATRLTKLVNLRAPDMTIRAEVDLIWRAFAEWCAERGYEPNQHPLEDRPIVSPAPAASTNGGGGSVDEALDFIRDGLEFAYANGLHEVGYDPVKRILAALQPQPSQQDGTEGERARIIDAICRTSPFGPDYKHADFVRMAQAIQAALNTSEARG